MADGPSRRRGGGEWGWIPRLRPAGLRAGAPEPPLLSLSRFGALSLIAQSFLRALIRSRPRAERSPGTWLGCPGRTCRDR